MALTIEGATQGFDANNVQDYINDLNIAVVDAAKSSLDNQMDTLRTAVDTVWVGKSAENFKKNMETDVEAIKDALDEAKDALLSELYDIVDKLGEMDEGLVQLR